MSFKFKLQKLLEYKITLEDLKKSQYGEAVYRHSEEEERLNDFYNEKDLMVTRGEACKKNVDINELRLTNDYIKALNLEIEDQKTILKAAEKEMYEKQNDLIGAMQERKSFEILKEKDYEDYLKDEKKKEEKMVDQIVTYKSNAQQQ